MKKLEKLEQEVKEIQKRNRRVELEKAWETSRTRKITITVLTYFVVSLMFFVIDVERPLVIAIIPTVGYVLSTLSIPYVKNWWMLKQKNK